MVNQASPRQRWTNFSKLNLAKDEDENEEQKRTKAGKYSDGYHKRNNYLIANKKKN